MFNPYRYNSNIDEYGLYACIECLPSLKNVIGSHNVTAVTSRRGTTYVDPSTNLIGFDNKFNPYHFQTHAGEFI